MSGASVEIVLSNESISDFINNTENIDPVIDNVEKLKDLQEKYFQVQEMKIWLFL